MISGLLKWINHLFILQLFNKEVIICSQLRSVIMIITFSSMYSKIGQSEHIV